MRKHSHRETLHHRRPKSLGGKMNAQNISVVPEFKHNSWHNLFGNKEPYEIAEIINSVWLDPDFKLICVRRYQ